MSSTRFSVFGLIGAAIALSSGPVQAQDAGEDPLLCADAVAETIYVPAFSRVHTGARQSQPLASTLVVHNVDPDTSITIETAVLYDSAGNEVEDLLEAFVTLAPFASTNVLTEISDDRGGIGANYIVTWTSDAPACSPVAVAVMIGGTGTLGISFALEGRVIARTMAEGE